ncbi:hypothetical protein BXY82_0108 [Gelidibacter sediminis]|uniref:Uncharacterized protein n=1 Tax=Gelidibacter sediminis TaxID=1608710 RepID=A0A4R7Q5A6_9FLAO|nr:hypothetical protein [Gelidibacter sediminis]TDU42715.1 hypothetical protein BXY82_0108 [Gelidibacter sediminis]
MKKLILSFAALAFATYLFSQDDSDNATEKDSYSAAVVMQDGFHNDTKLSQ